MAGAVIDIHTRTIVAGPLPTRVSDEQLEARMYLEIAAAIERLLEQASPAYPRRARLARKLNRLRLLAPRHVPAAPLPSPSGE